MFKFQIVVNNNLSGELFRSDVLENETEEVTLGIVYDVLTANRVVFAAGDNVSIEEIK